MVVDLVVMVGCVLLSQYFGFPDMRQALYHSATSVTFSFYFYFEISSPRF